MSTKQIGLAILFYAAGHFVAWLVAAMPWSGLSVREHVAGLALWFACIGLARDFAPTSEG